MKKILTLLVFTLFSFVVNAQQPTVDTATISNAERIVDKYTGKIADAFTNGIEKVTPVAIDGFKLVCRLQIAIGLFDLAMVGICVLCLFAFFKEYNRINNLLHSEKCPRRMDPNEGPFYVSNYTAKLSMFFGSSMLFGILAPFCLYEAFTHLIAPEWFAIKEIIKLFN